ncbi:MAG: nucleotidyltransferase domain-containing protein [Candidatus Falkowbacteria bacterium]|nr:nucleotidyltransferase domain-containing protein [Candidatus Falkowbacteria bacterium]
MLDFFKNGKGEILKLLFSDPEKDYYLREIAKSLNKEPSHYQRHLDELVDQGILQDERKGNMRFFRLNKNYHLFAELKSIISKTVGLEAKLRNLVDKFNDLDGAFLFGSIAKNKENGNSDVDLMLVGKIDQNILINEISKIEGEINREINYHIFSRAEVIKKIKENDSFFINIFSSPLISLKGDSYEFTKIIK